MSLESPCSPGAHCRRGLVYRFHHRWRSALVLALAGGLLAGLSPLVQAQEDDAAPTQASDPASLRRNSDASADRNLLLPTAETLPDGAGAFNSYELILAGLSYGVTDRVELSGTTLLPITSDIPFFLTASLKWNFHRSDQLLVSVMPTAMFLSVEGGSGGGFGGSVIADYIFDQEGRYALTGGLMTQFVFGGNGDDVVFADGAFLALWSGFSARLGRNVKLLGELILPGGYTWVAGGDFELVEEGLLFGYGVRFFGESLAVDLSFLRPIHPDVDTGNLVMGLPWVAFSARF